MSITLILPLTATARMSRKARISIMKNFLLMLFSLFPISQVWLGSTSNSNLSRVILIKLLQLLSILRGKIELPLGYDMNNFVLSKLS